MNNLYCSKNNFCTCMTQCPNEDTFNLEIKNNGFFQAEIILSYRCSGKFVTAKRSGLSYGKKFVFEYPRAAYEVLVSIYNESVSPKTIVCIKNYQQAKDILILLWGTVTATNCTESNNFNWNYENLCQCCCSQAMNNCILNCIK
ncbi:hypothetical protein G8S21_08820 [Clostridium botulinum C]|uniref:hypothetical protein n=1 Tax=Clostridium botulinum TaxID=1491 RepID=UPI001E4FD5AC|nr:hypothetical protein [Clostridium botulinum]MCD3246038.1 hypothetical protein [Clostridium botulinum C]MCD3262536.1 hypothetical protein [Clostridium botulinum C]